MYITKRMKKEKVIRPGFTSNMLRRISAIGTTTPEHPFRVIAVQKGDVFVAQTTSQKPAQQIQ